MVYTPGIIAWAINGYHFPEHRPKILEIMTGTFPDVDQDKMDALLKGDITYTIEGETVLFDA